MQQHKIEVKFEILNGYNISYSTNQFFTYLKLLVQLPKICYKIYYENSWLKNYLQHNKIDAIISDNRYGFYNKKVKSFFITHQLKVLAGNAFTEMMMQQFMYHFINKFNACLVPDFKEEPNISGNLSHPKKLPKITVHYMGLLSRFEEIKKENMVYNYCIILSGPEPQRTIFEQIILKEFDDYDKAIVVVRGTSKPLLSLNYNKNIQAYNQLATDELLKLVAQSNFVICRSGYTSLMEWISTQTKTIVVPTPAQTEQEYLAEKLMKNNWAFAVNQNEFDVKNFEEELKNFDYDFPNFNNAKLLLPKVLDSLL